jgi:carboxylesterase type B
MVMGRPATSADTGARHAGEIQYVFGTLASVPDVVWEASDKMLSDAMTSYWANFGQKGGPERRGLAGVAEVRSEGPPRAARRRDDQGCP